jgi:hypothetical protein
MEIGMYYNTLYVHIWRIAMLETHRNINKNDKLPNSRIVRCLQICIDSLDWIGKNSTFQTHNEQRARKTLKEIKRILGK